ncbi:MAG TPA: hypothetical protein PLM71_04010 [Syntrophorhabdaceae bacterium]|nr:hypothetical protein [Syntrophorhabdaceae bacterium]HPU29471.1 hypothetical protein [Syntrophorhabdaceae bacterium]
MAQRMGGRGQGAQGQKAGMGRRLAGSGGRGRMGGRGLGPGGECVCPQCGTRTPHQQGIPCYEQKCPNCSTPMVRA